MLGHAKLLLVATVVAAALTGASAPAAPGTQPVTSGDLEARLAAAATETKLACAPQLNWDSPLDQAKIATSSSARILGRLPFAPVVPRFGVRPQLVQVSDPDRVAAADRSVAFLYRFATGPAFPSNGRIVVKESTATMTPDTLRAIAADPGASAAVTFRMISFGGTAALLSSANGVGRVQFVRGGVEYDVTGPAVAPAEVQRLAALIR